jgi:hypothetical protein
MLGMHTQEGKLFGHRELEDFTSRYSGLRGIDVEDHSRFRKRRLHLWNMDGIPPDQQFASFR